MAIKKRVNGQWVDAVVVDTATATKAGLMSSEDKVILDGLTNYINTRDSEILSIAKTYTQEQIADLVDAAPEKLNTLNELSAALNNDANFAVSMGNHLATKVDKVNGKGLSDNNYSTTEKNKLAGIADGANKYTHPSYTARSSGLYKITVDASGHVSSVTAVTKGDITALGIPGQDTNTTYSNATSGAAGLMSAGDKSKLDGIAAGANNYSLPAATSSTLGGVKVGSNITNNSGTISLSGSNVTSALGYTPIKSIGTGSSNGTISVDGANVAVKGLGSAAYSNTSAFAASGHGHSEYVPTSRTINGKALTGNIQITASDVGAKSSGDKEVFWATYGSTTYNEIKSAYDAGKIVYISDKSYPSFKFPLTWVTDRDCGFYGVSSTISLLNDNVIMIEMIVDSSNNWSRFAITNGNNRATPVYAADTNYTEFIGRGIALYDKNTIDGMGDNIKSSTGIENGGIIFSYE